MQAMTDKVQLPRNLNWKHTPTKIVSYEKSTIKPQKKKQLKEEMEREECVHRSVFFHPLWQSGYCIGSEHL